eukprot:gene55633-21661_t
MGGFRVRVERTMSAVMSLLEQHPPCTRARALPERGGVSAALVDDVHAAFRGLIESLSAVDPVGPASCWIDAAAPSADVVRPIVLSIVDHAVDVAAPDRAVARLEDGMRDLRHRLAAAERAATRGEVGAVVLT